MSYGCVRLITAVCSLCDPKRPMESTLHLLGSRRCEPLRNVEADEPVKLVLWVRLQLPTLPDDLGGFAVALATD